MNSSRPALLLQSEHPSDRSPIIRTTNPMRKSRRFLMLSLAVILGAGAFGLDSILTPPALAQTDTLVTMCFRNRTIQVPFYLRPRYIAGGAMDGPCPASNP
jgi:hypothetical protein